jgi:hypothetical protein
MAKDEEKERYGMFLRNLIPACMTRGVRQIDQDNDRLVRGLKRALEVLRKKRIRVKFNLEGFDPRKFWEIGHEKGVFDGITRGSRSARINYDNADHAYECLRFNGLDDKKIEGYREAARVFMIEMTGGSGAQPTNHCMRAVGYRGIRGKQRY